MNTRDFFTTLADIFKIAIAAWSVTWIEPWVEQFLPATPDALKYLIASVIAAAMLFVLTHLLGWPTVKIEWLEDSTPLDKLNIRLLARNPGQSQPFTLRVAPGGKGLLGHAILRCAIRPGSVLKISVQNASVEATCEHSTKRSGIPTVTSSLNVNGVEVDLGEPPERPGAWHIATIRWKDDETPCDEDYHIKYSFESDGRIRQFIQKWLIFKSIKASKFRVQG